MEPFGSKYFVLASALFLMRRDLTTPAFNSMTVMPKGSNSSRMPFENIAAAAFCDIKTLLSIEQVRLFLFGVNS